MSIQLHLPKDAKEILTLHHHDQYLTLDNTGEMKLNDTEQTKGPAPYEEEIYFLAKRYKFGMAFIPEERYREMTTNFKEKTYFYDSPTKAVLFKVLLPIDVQFSLPVDLEPILKYFQIGCHSKSGHERPELMERVLSVRTIHKLETIPEDICCLVRNLYFIEKTLGSHIEQALEYFLLKKPKRRNTVKWKDRIFNLKEDLLMKKQRMAIYNEMLRQNVFPNYYEFLQCEGDLKNLDVSRFIPILGLKPLEEEVVEKKRKSSKARSSI